MRQLLKLSSDCEDHSSIHLLTSQERRNLPILISYLRQFIDSRMSSTNISALADLLSETCRKSCHLPLSLNQCFQLRLKVAEFGDKFFYSFGLSTREKREHRTSSWKAWMSEHESVFYESWRLRASNGKSIETLVLSRELKREYPKKTLTPHGAGVENHLTQTWRRSWDQKAAHIGEK